MVNQEDFGLSLESFWLGLVCGGKELPKDVDGHSQAAENFCLCIYP